MVQEQQLAPQAAGSTGKYASIYHPSEQEYQSLVKGMGKSPVFRTTSSNSRGTRPLTMGELQANWREQDLVEVLRTKFPIVNGKKKQDPLPVLSEAATTYYAQHANLAARDAALVAAFSYTHRPVVITAHDSDQPLTMGLGVNVVSRTETMDAVWRLGRAHEIDDASVVSREQALQLLQPPGFE